MSALRLTGIATLAGLASCVAQPQPLTPEPETPSTQAVPSEPAKSGVDRFSRSDNLWKVCDEGRAVYVYSGYKSGGVAVVEGAPECAS